MQMYKMSYNAFPYLLAFLVTFVCVTLLFSPVEKETLQEVYRKAPSVSYPIQSLAEETLEYFFPIRESLSQSVEGNILRPLPAYRSPCWMEKLDNRTRPTKNRYITMGYPSQHETRPAMAHLEEYYTKRLSRGENGRLRCLPAVYLAAIYKGGTSDLHRAIAQHPLIVSPVIKEPINHLWGTGSFSPYGFKAYLGLYDSSAKTIQEFNDERRTVNPLLTLDCSPVYLHMYTHWKQLPWNYNASEPRLIVAHHLKILNPHARFLFVLREPADWVTSCYNFFHKHSKDFSARDLHDRTETSISAFRQCETTYSVRRCVYQHNDDICDVLNAIYYVFLRDWMEIFDRRQLYVMKSEDYFKNRLSILDDIFQFLEIPSMPTKLREEISRAPVENKGKRPINMLPETSSLIRGFMAKWNWQLAELLGHAKPLW